MKKRGVKLFVRGDCREILDSQCDFPINIEESIKEFSEFDFSHIQTAVEEFGPFFVMNYLDNEESKAKLLDAYKKMKECATSKEISQLFIDLLKEAYTTGNMIENNWNMFTRINRVKNWVKQFIAENDIKDEELVIVAHSRFGKAWTAKDCNQSTNEFKDFYAMKNCEVLEYEL